MADTRKLKNQVEEWFRSELKKEYLHETVKKEKVRLIWDGEFEYDAVIRGKDKSINSVYLLSCSEFKTASGKGGMGKLHKIKSDILMMAGTDCPNKILVFTGKTMYEKIESEIEKGRLPRDIKIKFLKNLPNDIKNLINNIVEESSKEVTPKY